MRQYSNPHSFQKYLFLEGISLGVAILLPENPKPLYKRLASMFFPNKRIMVATRGHTDHLGFAPSLLYFLWLLSSQRRVLSTDVLLLWVSRQADKGEKLGLQHCSSVPQSSWNTGCTPTFGCGAPAPSSFSLVEPRAGIGINNSSQMVEGKKVGKKEIESEREASSRR